jgi:hypothetical protein
VEILEGPKGLQASRAVPGEDSRRVGCYGGGVRLSFEQWKDEVEKALVKISGMDSESFPDWGYKEAWERGMTPLAAAKKALRAAEKF